MCSILQSQSQQVSLQKKRHEGKMTGVKAKKPNKPVRDRLCICIFPLGVEFAFEAGFGFG
jgi:hypothetical protein